MKICFITVNYNNSELCQKYLKSILNLKREKSDEIDVIIVDNNSNFLEREKLKNLFYEYLKIIYNSENIGYFSGLNTGLESVKNKKYDYIVIGNNDIIFDFDFLENLKKSEYDKETLVVCPNLRTKNGKKQNPMQKRRYTKREKIKADIYFINFYFSKLISKILQKFFPQKTREVEWQNSGYIWIGIGACYILVNNFRKYISKLDDRVFLWGEEALLANQVHSLNKKVYYDASIEAVHYENASVKRFKSCEKYKILKKSYKVYRNYL